MYITHTSHVHVARVYHACMSMTCMHVYSYMDMSCRTSASSLLALPKRNLTHLTLYSYALCFPCEGVETVFLEEIPISLFYQHSAPQLGVRKAS